MIELFKKNYLKVGFFMINILLIASGVLAIANKQQKQKNAIQEAAMQDAVSASDIAVGQARQAADNYKQDVPGSTALPGKQTVSQAQPKPVSAVQPQVPAPTVKTKTS